MGKYQQYSTKNERQDYCLILVIMIRYTCITIYSLTLPPFPPFPGAAYGASLLGNIMYRGNLAQAPHNRAAGSGMQRVSSGGMARGFDNCKYSYAIEIIQS